eukprot:Gregarina_sp_Pseudo_9__2967@NODE_317_length_3180_cov_11_356256_g298_i0_p2_GENE_NODE_317_length_3180_cov_11_356256_g298_i0NODE_317_length_3180_cov_11_356256_g298_i0_p2_ORF_typecomplete_len324_score32_44_NODE_317_length_3180_cov_11_356256_g298_i017492720
MVTTITTPITRIHPSSSTGKIHKSEDEAELKLVHALKIDVSLFQSQCLLGGDTPSVWPFWTTGKTEETWNGIFNCICTILGSYVITQGQIKSLLNETYSKHKSQIVLSDDILRVILARCTKCADVQIADENQIQSLLHPPTSAVKIIDTGLRCLWRIVSIFFYDRFVNGSQEQPAHYLVINRTLLSKALATMMKNQKGDGNKHCDTPSGLTRLTQQPPVLSDRAAGYSILPIQDLMTSVLEPAFPGIAHLTPEVQTCALVLAVNELKTVYKAHEVRPGFLLIPLLEESKTATPVPNEEQTLSKCSLGVGPKLRPHRSAARKIR